VFLDIFPILRNPIAFETLITHFLHHLTSHTIAAAPNRKIDVVVGLDARGFLLGPIIALRLGAAFVPVRKQGKLPGECVSASYEKEYGTVSRNFFLCAMQMNDRESLGLVRDAGGCDKARTDRRCRRRPDCDRFVPSSPPDGRSSDIRLGGSAKAAGELIAKQGGKTVEYLFIIELMFLKGGSQLDAPVYSIVQSDD
jgi:adenine phosphoribosyltransferase